MTRTLDAVAYTDGLAVVEPLGEGAGKRGVVEVWKGGHGVRRYFTTRARWAWSAVNLLLLLGGKKTVVEGRRTRSSFSRSS